ncbi:DMT family transporter [Roseobacteraceae bacterium S113]
MRVERGRAALNRTAPETLAALGLLLGGAMWGLYWIPVRGFAMLGLSGSWPGIVMYVLAWGALVPFVWRIRAGLLSQWRTLVLSGLFTGAAFSLYSTSLVYTDVVRSILLFYLTPIWGTLLGLMFLGERLEARRVLGLSCGLGGLFVVLGGETGLPLPRNTGDWLALSSGMAWALGSLGLYKARGIPVSGQIFAFVSGALVVAVLAVVVEMQLGRGLPSAAILATAAPWALLSVVYVVPMLFLTIWPATMLSPARVGLLLMSEVVVGLASAAFLSGEAFGWREGFGGVLIVGAALLEVAPKRA